MEKRRLEVDSEQEMERLGAELVQVFLAERNEALVLQLVGDLGAGKTTLTRGIARGLGIAEPITSPTFQVHKEYPASPPATAPSATEPPLMPQKSPTQENLILHHFDFYRLQDLGVMKNELEELMADKNNVIVIEWGGILGDLTKNAKTIKIEKLTDEKRVLLLE
ncbi:MAG: tRNA (adenosine(37)-N6)-threonylcarbamoyltransferase complex ATPase subunit type 1 TsaE [Candidatus Nomurabacteria bacterium]|jgi:tRNA threonylcarbamoyladenosine biosynthesis protein TsaE|nr:tRNA (adenosine(37)-N6)-threonylcarbamoyltransferase complex ATPase subunit type 1 TsaE [Candidatus Nomurabacteria bacterium]